MQNLLEKNGKPCCLNLITESDSKFLGKLAKEKRLAEEAVAEQLRLQQVAEAEEAAKNSKDNKKAAGKEDPKAAALA